MLNPVVLTNDNSDQINDLDNYFELQKKIYDIFGYDENYCIFPMVDDRDKYWILRENEILTSENERNLTDLSKGNYYAGTIYKQRFLNKWVYDANEYNCTMALINTQTDGNIYFQILDNNKRIQ